MSNYAVLAIWNSQRRASVPLCVLCQCLRPWRSKKKFSGYNALPGASSSGLRCRNPCITAPQLAMLAIKPILMYIRIGMHWLLSSVPSWVMVLWWFFWFWGFWKSHLVGKKQHDGLETLLACKSSTLPRDLKGRAWLHAYKQVHQLSSIHIKSRLTCLKLHVEEVCFSAASIEFGYLLSIWASIYIVSEKEVVAVRPRWIMVDPGKIWKNAGWQGDRRWMFNSSSANRGIESDRVR